MRKISKVIEKIKAVIPDSFQDKEFLVIALNNVLDSSSYRAPELYYLNFEQTASVLQHYLGEPDTEWKKEIVRIFSDK